MQKRLVRLAVIVCGALIGREAGAVQPELVWGTYLGGPGQDALWSVAIDPAGNVYVTGYSSSLQDIATPGAHKAAPQQQDGILVKFGPDGTRLWGTYFGGSVFDLPATVSAGADVVIIGGVTQSDDGIAYGATYQTKKPPLNQSGFVAAFSPDGTLQWGTYIPGSVRSVAVVDQNHVFVCGSTFGYPGIADGALHQPGFGGQTDGYILRLDDTGNRVWGTYYGGEKFDENAGLAWRSDGTLFVGGYSSSPNNIASDGAFQTAVSSGKNDLFVAVFDADDGVRQWATYFGGAESEIVSTVAAYPGGGGVLAGRTQSPGLATDATAHSGFQSTVIVRFDESGQRLWSTYFAGQAEMEHDGLGIREDGSIYIAGTTSSPGLATPNALKTSLTGSYNAYIAKLDGGAGQRVWSSYYGGAIVPDKIDLAYAGGRLYLAGVTGDPGFSTPGSHQPKPAGVGDGFLARFNPVDALGGSCGVADDCESKLCVDGVCCDTACGDGDETDCQACSKAAGAAVDGTCGPRLPGGVCRPAAGECDSEEQCDGVDLVCPPDVVADDGTPCTGGQCDAGMCIPNEGTTGDMTTTTGTTSTTGGLTDTSGGPSTTASDDTTGSAPTTGGEPGGSTVASSDPTGSPDGGATATGAASGATATEGPAEIGENGCGCKTSSPSFLVLLFALTPLRRRRSSPRTRPNPARVMPTAALSLAALSGCWRRRAARSSRKRPTNGRSGRRRPGSLVQTSGTAASRCSDRNAGGRVEHPGPSL